MVRFDLTDFEWSVIQPLLPTKVPGVKRVDDRRVLNGIFCGHGRALRGPISRRATGRTRPASTGSTGGGRRMCGHGYWKPYQELTTAISRLSIVRRSAFTSTPSTPKKDGPGCMGRSRGGVATGLATRYDKRDDNFLASFQPLLLFGAAERTRSGNMHDSDTPFFTNK
jgi:transposase